MPEAFFHLDIWKKAYELTLKTYSLTFSFPSTEQYGLTNQLRRSANSVAANIAESQGRFSYNDRMRVLYVARGEIFETRSHLKIAEGLGLIDTKVSKECDDEYEGLLISLNAYIRHLAEKRSPN
jgi:four helix bundle protein